MTTYIMEGTIEKDGMMDTFAGAFRDGEGGAHGAMQTSLGRYTLRIDESPRGAVITQIGADGKVIKYYLMMPDDIQRNRGIYRGHVFGVDSKPVRVKMEIMFYGDDPIYDGLLVV